MKKALFLLATLSLVAAISLQSALGATRASESAAAVPGITKNTITIGGTFPLTGPASLYAPIPKGMDAYFTWANQRKGADGKLGVYGRKTVWKYYDDGYNPANTVQLTNQLVLQDTSLAIARTRGPEPNIPDQPAAEQPQGPPHPGLDRGELLGAAVQAVPVDERLAAGLHRRGDRVRALDRPERPEREDRRVLPERRLREGLSQGPQDRARGEADAHRL